MAAAPAPSVGAPDPRPLVISLCGTYLKPEMQSLYRQIAGLRRHRTIVLAEQVENTGLFPFPEIIRMTKLHRPRARGNFLLRFWYKHVVKQWPPPRPITREVACYHPYNLPALVADAAPALIHVYYGHKAVKYLWMLLATRVPFVISFHGVDVVKFLDQPLYRDTLKVAFNEAELVMARSESLLARLRELGCPEDKLRLNRTPIPLDGIAFAERRPPADGAWRIIQACRLIPKKGILTVLDALPAVLRVHPKLKYILAGSGPMRDEIAAAVRERGLGESVELSGWLDQAQLRAEYARAHAFIHPSQLTEENDQEGVPNSMLEAMAAGLPVVATLHGGIPEAVTNGHDGLLVRERDPDALAGALLALLGDPDILARLSRNAAASVREKFGHERQIENLEDIYAEAIRRGGEAGAPA